MKYFTAITFVVVLFSLAQVNAVTAHSDSETCAVGVKSACVDNGSGDDVKTCNAILMPNEHLTGHMQKFAQSHLLKSYEYLLMSTHFNSHQMNRPGLKQLFEGLSDRAFDDTIALVRHLAYRGSKANFGLGRNGDKRPVLQLNEMASLAYALDIEKGLAREAMALYNSATHNKVHDPEIGHFIEEKFLVSHVAAVRKLSGYTNDLSKLVKPGQPAFNVYMFDEYLKKQ